MKTILPMLIGVGFALSGAGVNAQPVSNQQVKVEIESQLLRDALNEWAQQTGFQLVSPSSEVTSQFVASSIKGTLSPQAALEKLLADTPLTYAWLSERVVAIRERSKPAVASVGWQTIANESAPRLRLAYLGDESKSEERIAQTNTSTAERQNVLHKSQKTDAIAEVVVTGTHIRGLQNRTAPVTVLDRADIDATGLSNVSALIQTLPQNFALANQAGVLVPGVSEPGVQGSAINLRGLGEGTTLVLLNGRRLAPGFGGSAVDIAALPLTAIERVEVLTDGASAIYGSDAVGGVVNFILRDDFEGAETRVRAGSADGGLNEYRINQLLGNKWASGNALVSLEYYKRDLLPASERDFVPETAIVGSLFPRDENYSAVLSARQSITEAFDVFTDALYAKRDSYNEGGRITLAENSTIENPQLTATVGANWQIVRDWEVELSAGYARNKLDQKQNSDLNASDGSFIVNSLFEIESVHLTGDGSLLDLPGGAARLAVGIDWRTESYERSSQYMSGARPSTREADQIVRSAFAELYVPIIGDANAVAGGHRLDLSLAGRFDDYSSFGSSFDPRFGLAWEPTSGLRFRGNYGTSYAAPRLADYSLSGNAAIALTSLDPGAAGGLSRQLQVIGNDVGGFQAQESESLSFGVEYSPLFARGLRLGVNYYDIDYRDRIATPQGASVVLGNPASFGDLFIRSPSVEQVNQYIAIGQLGRGLFALIPNFSPALIDVIVDLRRRNLSIVRTTGWDAAIQYDFQVGGNDFHLGIDGTHISRLEQQATDTSAAFDTVDTFYNPPDWRARGTLGWRLRGWAADLFVNYTDSYSNNRTPVATGVSSYTTADAQFRYDFGVASRSGPLSGLTISANVQNLFDRDPPSTAIVNTDTDMGFDPTNASPMGRFISIEVVKAW